MLWEEMEFSGSLVQQEIDLKAQRFLAWLLSRASAVRTLKVSLSVPGAGLFLIDDELEARQALASNAYRLCNTLDLYRGEEMQAST